jgi:hypothetical protein
MVSRSRGTPTIYWPGAGHSSRQAGEVLGASVNRKEADICACDGMHQQQGVSKGPHQIPNHKTTDTLCFRTPLLPCCESSRWLTSFPNHRFWCCLHSACAASRVVAPAWTAPRTLFAGHRDYTPH